MADAQRISLPQDAAPSPLGVLELPAAQDIPGYNRRSLPRVAGQFTVQPVDGDAPMRGIDLSFGGLMCASNEPVWPGNRLAFYLHLANRQAPIFVDGEVVDLVSCGRQIGMRVRFHDVSQADRKAIARWMAEQANRP